MRGENEEGNLPLTDATLMLRGRSLPGAHDSHTDRNVQATSSLPGASSSSTDASPAADTADHRSAETISAQRLVGVCERVCTFRHANLRHHAQRLRQGRGSLKLVSPAITRLSLSRPGGMGGRGIQR